MVVVVVVSLISACPSQIDKRGFDSIRVASRPLELKKNALKRQGFINCFWRLITCYEWVFYLESSDDGWMILVSLVPWLIDLLSDIRFLLSLCDWLAPGLWQRTSISPTIIAFPLFFTLELNVPVRLPRLVTSDAYPAGAIKEGRPFLQ